MALRSLLYTPPSHSMANTRKRSSRGANLNAASGSASEAEPAAKRIAIADDQEELDDDQDQEQDGQPKEPDPLITAQAAIDRLDIKSALQICNQVSRLCLRERKVRHLY